MADTLNDIHLAYGDSVYPLYKVIGPFMKNEPTKDEVAKFDNEIIELKNNGKTHDEIRKIYKVGASTVAKSLKRSGGKVQKTGKKTFGYIGMVLYDRAEDKVQCGICGEWFRSLGNHVFQKHGMTAKEYKDKFGLYYKTALCSKEVSKKRSEAIPEQFVKYRKSKKHIEELVVANKKRKKPHRCGVMQGKNKHGLCDEQIKKRLLVVRNMSNKVEMSDVTISDVHKYDSPLHMHLISKYGKVKSVAERFNLLAGGRIKHQEIDLISKLRTFVLKNKKMIKTKDVDGNPNIPSVGTYQLRFGSWRRAKMMAGLDQLLAEVKA